MDLDFPTDRDLNSTAAENARTSFKRDTKRYQMLPTKDGEVADNRLLLGAFRYDQFRLFEKWPLANYYLKLKVVYVQVEEEGRMIRRPVLSEREMNYYARTTLSTPNKAVPQLFAKDTDPFYDYSQELWKEYAEAKKAAGLEKLSKDEFKAAMDARPDIKRIREAAKEWSADDRFFFAVFDYAKYTGQKPLADEDEGSIGWQGLLGPQSILDRLYIKQKAGKKFWDFAGGGARVVLVTRDNTRGARNCEYFVELEDDAPTIDGETLAYLEKGDDIPDPSDEVLVWSEEQKRAYLEAYAKDSGLKKTEPSTRPAVRAAGSEVVTKAEEPAKVETPATINRPLGAAVRPRAAAQAKEEPKPEKQQEAPAQEAQPEASAEVAAETKTDTKPAEGARRPKVSWRK